MISKDFFKALEVLADERKIEKESYIFQQGVQYGYNQTIIGIVQQAITCEPVSLNIENSTFELIAIKCLNQA